MVFKFLTVKPIFPHFFAQTCYKQIPACSLSQDTKCLRKPLCFEGEIQNKTYCHKSNIHCSRKSPGTPLHELTGLGRLVVVVHGQDIFFLSFFISTKSGAYVFKTNLLVSSLRTCITLMWLLSEARLFILRIQCVSIAQRNLQKMQIHLHYLPQSII